jgi:asparagine synthase (glutamine-hydrolysing)
MCGIAGFVGAGSRTDLSRMTDALAHRGPDGEGYYVDEKSATYLGHRRLAIVDIAGGHQPMWNEDETVGVIFNGEIYNHHELRTELIGRGHKFQSDHSDTEVLVHGYEEWGRALPERLNGMFAFAITDLRSQTIFLARDRFGEKPLYYSSKPGCFAFASELTALIEHRAVGRTLNQRALRKYFAYGYIPAPLSAIEGVCKLPGGHWLSFDTRSGHAETGCYWRFNIEADDRLNHVDEQTLAEELAGLIATASHRRMMSDVPVGVFLSGGLDSSSILASLAQKAEPQLLKTFTIGFTEASFDESHHARRIAAHVGSTHNEKILDLETARELILPILAKLDEPMADASIIPTYLLCQYTRNHVTVALSGDGGDELFAGYDPFAALGIAKLYANIVPQPLHTFARKMANWMPVSDRNMSLDFKIRRGLMGLSYPEPTWLPAWMSPLEPKALSEFLSEPVSARELYDEAVGLWERDPTKSAVDRGLEFFTQFYLQDDILAKVDRAAMMNSLESRAVFLDNDIVHFCQRLPARFKMRGKSRKYLLKMAVERLLPRDVIDRKKKGFGIPLNAWLRTIPVDPPFAPIDGFDTAYARQAFGEHRSGIRDHRLFLWSWLGLQAFQQRLGGTSIGTGKKTC